MRKKYILLHYDINHNFGTNKKKSKSLKIVVLFNFGKFLTSQNSIWSWDDYCRGFNGPGPLVHLHIREAVISKNYYWHCPRVLVAKPLWTMSNMNIFVIFLDALASLRPMMEINWLVNWQQCQHCQQCHYCQQCLYCQQYFEIFWDISIVKVL